MGAFDFGLLGPFFVLVYFKIAVFRWILVEDKFREVEFTMHAKVVNFWRCSRSNSWEGIVFLIEKLFVSNAFTHPFSEIVIGILSYIKFRGLLFKSSAINYIKFLHNSSFKFLTIKYFSIYYFRRQLDFISLWADPKYIQYLLFQICTPINTTPTDSIIIQMQRTYEGTFCNCLTNLVNPIIAKVHTRYI